MENVFEVKKEVLPETLKPKKMAKQSVFE